MKQKKREKKIKKLRAKRVRLMAKAATARCRVDKVDDKLRKLEPRRESFFERYARNLSSRPLTFNSPLFGLQFPFQSEPDPLDAETLEVDDDKDA